MARFISHQNCNDGTVERGAGQRKTNVGIAVCLGLALGQMVLEEITCPIC